MPKSIELLLQPKQFDVLDLIENSPAVVIGVGGGRGAAKSSGIDRIAITLMTERPTLCCMVMRTWPQLLTFHLEAMRRDFDWIKDGFKLSPPARLNIGKSQMDFKCGDSYDDIVQVFRSGNYDYIFVDQAEQFSEREIREMRKACRSKGKRKAKMIIAFNMRGSGIQTLRKWFYLKEYNKDESPDDYAFIKANPWDNIEWVRPALEEDGYTEFDYYDWTDEQRMSYAATRGEYTRQLASDDEVIRNADWYGGWDSLEGAYFVNSFDLESVRRPTWSIHELCKPQASHWIAQDWGKSHFCATYWAFRVSLKPSEAKLYLDWDLERPINVTCIHREMIVSEQEPTEVAQNIVDTTPDNERSKIREYFLSPEEVTEDANSIGAQQGRRLRQYHMPNPVKADNDRKGGYGLMSALFKASKGKGWGADKDGNRFQYDEAVLISTECAELLKSIPMLMRDPKNLDDVLKTDRGAAKIEQDCGDACRYLLKSMLAPRRMTRDEVVAEEQAQIQDPMALHFARLAETEKRKKRSEPLPYWS